MRSARRQQMQATRPMDRVPERDRAGCRTIAAPFGMGRAGAVRRVPRDGPGGPGPGGPGGGPSRPRKPPKGKPRLS